MFADHANENELKEMGGGDPDKEAQLPSNNVEEVHDFGNQPKADLENKGQVADNIYGIGSGVDEEANRGLQEHR